MPEPNVQSQHNSDQFLGWAAIAFAIGLSVHGLDHVRRGMSASPPFIMAAGTVQTMLVAATVVMVLRRRRRAPRAAIVIGFGSAAGFIYAHLLPTFLPGYQDSFVSLPHTNVTWFSWLSALAEIGTGIAFAIAGVQEVNNGRNPVFRRHLRHVHAVSRIRGEAQPHRPPADRTAAGPGSC